MNETYFFDTYAFIEMIKSNPAYAPFENVGIITTKLNIYELAKRVPHRAYLERQYETVVDIDFETILEAAKFWQSRKKQRMSMTDCIGYVMAMQLNIPFLTGDREFKGLPNVCFVK